MNRSRTFNFEEMDKLEAMGEALLGHDDVEGYLTAEDVISYIEKRG